LSENFAQPALQRHFCGTLGRRFQPGLKILDSNPMLDLGLFDGHHDARRAATGIVAPVVLPENAKRLSHGFE
jgi:hypothetical protein